MTPVFIAAVGFLADDNPRHTGPDFGKASPLGLLIIVLLLIGTFALIWSMNRHLKKLPERFGRTQSEPDQIADHATEEPPSDAPPDDENSRHEPG
ncbi:MAG TPA: hypothetical protein VH496_20595 [Mycobacterium sp.]|jgi:hypothetical protein